MNRPHLGRGRLIVAAGSLITLAATILPWYTVGGVVLDSRSENAFSGAGILVFIAAVLLLGLVTLPYASREGRASLDRPLAYALVAALGIVGLLLRIVQLSALSALGLPDRAPGLWLAGVGLVVVGWGVAEILAEPAPLR